MIRWVVKLSEVYLSLMADCMKKDILQNHVIYADETHVLVSKNVWNATIIYFIAETDNANKLNPYEYFKHLLNETKKHIDDISFDFMEDLLPWSDSLPDSYRNRQDEKNMDIQK